jgi:uncharacterized repeat protein (TIGR03847 family)
VSTNESFEFPAPDRLTVGTRGEPGQRMFFLQARQGRTIVTLKMEKAQVAALAAWIVKTLEDLPAPGDLPDNDLLEAEPFDDPAWAVGSLGGSYDPDSDRVILVAAELTEAEEDDEEEDDDLLGGDGATARFLATREQVAALAIRSAVLVEAGRPPCPLCGYPIDPKTGHQCPKKNGHRPPTL